jgi:hypothetical protein
MSRQVCAAVWDRQLRICSTENNTSHSWVAQARFLLEIAERRHRRLHPLDRALGLVQLEMFRRMSPALKPRLSAAEVPPEPHRLHKLRRPPQPVRVARVVRAASRRAHLRCPRSY